MDDEMRRLCEEYALAWYFDKPRRIALQNAYYKKRKEFSPEVKDQISDYFEECRKKNEEMFPHTEHIGWMQFEIVNLNEE